ncbi:MAG: glycosyltransferase family 2 protein [Candidatus Limivivens sp.]|nr:glycosyltransferase family 2 protein [Candidatus Limivivens sp.]
MKPQLLEVKRDRFHLLKDQVYLLQGNWPKGYDLKACLDRQELEAAKEPWESTSALERFSESEMLNGEKVTVSVTLPEDLEHYKRLYVYACAGSEKKIWYEVAVSELLKKWKQPQFYLEEELVSPAEGTIRLRGWAVDRCEVQIALFDWNRKKLPCQIQKTARLDVVQMYKECPVQEKCGFFIELNQIPARGFYLMFKTKERKAVYTVHTAKGAILRKKAEKYWTKGWDYYRAHGVSALGAKVYRKFFTDKEKPVDYQKWIAKHLPGPGELEKQRRTAFEVQPVFSIVVPLYKTPESFLDQLIRSVQNQTYTRWELCLSDGSGADSPLREILEKYQRLDGRIRVISHETPLQISENTNAAMEASTGDYLVFADHDDVLTPNALFECAQAINRALETDVLYSDEDKMSMDGNKFFQPHMKPDFNPDLLCTVNYICHLFVAKRTLVEKVGMLRPEFDGAQDYDFIFRCTEKAEKICHIPKVLYHWRSHEDSTAENPESKMYAFDAGARAVAAHYERIGVKAEVSKGEYLGLYRTRFIRDYDPLISIIIPNKDHISDLKRCMNSIEEKSAYPNYEFIIVENNSTEEETFAWYRELEQKDPRAKVVYWEGEFNYSAINNFGVRAAKGEYLLLLNNDTEMINPDCLEELLGYCMREDVGAVGARLYYEDDTIQHAGVVIGFGGIAGHCFVQQKRDFTGYCHRIICAQDYSAVTAACMMVKRSVFEEVGGLSEDLKVAFNDIDFCLKIGAAGKLVVYNPYAELYHYESKSRGLEDTPEKLARFHREIALLEQKWPDIFKNGDPYYNPNLTLDSQDFSLKRI